MIPVTKPFLPEKSVYDAYLQKIWDINWLTNNGPLLNELEIALKRRLGLDHLLVLGNGTIAIQIAIKALELSGEIITTPFSYVATTSSIVWENSTPVFVDVDEDTYNIDPTKIEAAITENTTAILATHVFGNPCAVEQIQAIADQHNLKIIYDAAHCFGTTYKGESVFKYGDISTTSFHATKLFHTVEGGAVMTKDPEILKAMSFLRNFGHNGPDKFASVGINGKNSEFHAAMGLSVLPHMDDILAKRKQQYQYYVELLKGKLNVKFQSIEAHTDYNYSYFPIVFESEEALLKAMGNLNRQRIFPRRYFYPSLSSLDYLKETQPTPVSDRISKAVLCLPLYHDLTEESQNLIARILLRSQNY